MLCWKSLSSGTGVWTVSSLVVWHRGEGPGLWSPPGWVPALLRASPTPILQTLGLKRLLLPHHLSGANKVLLLGTAGSSSRVGSALHSPMGPGAVHLSGLHRVSVGIQRIKHVRSSQNLLWHWVSSILAAISRWREEIRNFYFLCAFLYIPCSLLLCCFSYPKCHLLYCRSYVCILCEILCAVVEDRQNA